MKGKRRVVITGLGLVTPLGNDVKTTWDNILAGKSGIANIDGFDVDGPDISEFKVRFAGRIKDFDPTEYIPAKDVKKFDAFTLYGIAAATQAFKDSNLELNT